VWGPPLGIDTDVWQVVPDVHDARRFPVVWSKIMIE
jgi:hypothetical protein